MTFWIIFGCVVLAVFVICLVRIGGLVDYSESGLSVVFQVGPLRFPVIPAAEKNRSKKKQADNGQKKPEKNKRNVGETVQMVKRYLPLIGDAAGRLKRKICINHIFLHLIWGSMDPADAALGYGAANALLGLLWPAIEHNFNIKKQEINVDLDYTLASPVISVKAQLTMTFGQLLALIAGLGYKALKIHLGLSREKTDEKAVQV